MATLKNTVIDSTGSIRLPVGTTAQRPVSPVLGMMRYNTEEEAVEIYDSEDWAVLGSSGGGLYSFTTATFTPGSQTGSTGPSLTQARNGLSGSGTEAWKNNTEFFNTTNGIQLWTVPQDGTYRIEARGGSGRTGNNDNTSGAVIIRADIQLAGGTTFRILVGQLAIDNSGVGAGGGGTFFVDENNIPYLIAGGSSGSLNGITDTEARGQTRTVGGSHSSRGSISQGGVNANNNNAGPGGGLRGDGAGSGSNRGLSFINGGTGGNGEGQGGFGGGGVRQGSWGFGAAGGYSGGNANWTSGSYPGGGGGSFIISSATNVATSNGTWTVNSGTPESAYSGSVANLNSWNKNNNGQVQITLL